MLGALVKTQEYPLADLTFNIKHVLGFTFAKLRRREAALSFPES